MSTAMIVVAAGSGSRFESDKILTPVDGVPMIAVTIGRLASHVDQCVLVCRSDQVFQLERMQLDAKLVEGGPSRTASEMAGLSAIDGEPELIGIHDGARPNISADLILRLFDAAARFGGAVPVVPAPGFLLEASTLTPVDGVAAAQTPQVFRGHVLREAYRKAQLAGFEGQDTHEVVSRFADVEVIGVEGDPRNLKVTYPDDLAKVIPIHSAI